MTKAAAIALCLAIAVSGQARSAGPETPRPPRPPRPPAVVNPTEVAPYVMTAPEQAPEQPALFTIGQLPVRVWTPEQPNYDQRNNRNGAANPVPDGDPL
jgi:hypothetical protein